MSTEQMGEEGFRWFLGIVEDIEGDPKQLGRVRVRIHNEHDEGVETDDLEWCQVLMPNTSECVGGVGDTPGLSVGTNVVGFFVDGQEKQLAMILGSYPTIPDMDDSKHALSYLARGKQTLEKEVIGPEPASAYGAKYPFNRVIQTKSGHVIELDDTPENERIHIFHKSGTYIEINSQGQIVLKSVADNYEIVKTKKTLYVGGDLNIEAVGTVNITAPTVNIKGNVNVEGKVTVSEDVVASGISLKDHKHGQVKAGPDKTGKPE